MDHSTSHTIDLRKPRVAHVPPVVLPNPVAPVVSARSMRRRNRYPIAMRFVAALTLIVFVTAPQARVFASEGDASTADVATVADTVADTVVVPVPDPVPEVPVVDTIVTEVLPAVEPVTVEPDSGNNLSEPAGEVLGEATSTEPVPVEEVPVTESVESELQPEEPVVTVPEQVYDDAFVETPPQTSISSSQYVFNPADCVVVTDGEFYCKKNDSTQTQTYTEPVGATVYAAPDGDGDLEIYFQNDSLTKQVTNNVFDDDAPRLDPDSGRIVWHALVHDRYQVFVYDPVVGDIRQVTHTTSNNTNPNIHNNVLVWQGWEDENWEIYTTTFVPAGTEFEIERRTRTGDNDMFPQVYGDFITWQSRIDDEWQTLGSNIKTGVQTVLGPGTGGDVESARMVLLIERRNAQGDVERVGYDVDTGSSIELGTAPQEAPVPLPVIPETQPEPLPPVAATSTPKIAEQSDLDPTADDDPLLVAPAE
jgi:hypothetical protein